MNTTVVALFDTDGDAQSAMNALFNEGFASADVRLSPAQDTPEGRRQALREQPATQTTPQTAAPQEGWHIGDFFRSLFGTSQPEEDAGLYSEAVRRGSYLLTVTAADEDEADRAADILGRFNPIDLEQRASAWRASGWTGYQSDAPVYTAEETRNELAGYSSRTTVSPATAAGTDTRSGETIPVIEEQLQVGKRAVQRGGVRIYRHVTETPVQESVQLREEHLTVERSPVDAPASAADIEAFKEGTIEVRETAEEPVVAKTARVVEEVRVDKEVTERTETISDTVRRTDVDVEPLGQAGTMGAAGAAPVSDEVFRQHWQTAYGSSGGKYEDYASAYRYGASLAGQQQYQGYRWDELEPRVRSDWEASHQGSPWDRTRQAVRYGWEKMTGR